MKAGDILIFEDNYIVFFDEDNYVIIRNESSSFGRLSNSSPVFLNVFKEYYMSDNSKETKYNIIKKEFAQ